MPTTPRISLIAAVALNGVIGLDNRLPWHLPADWENFRRVTAGRPFLMGRKSMEAPDALLSDTRNLILTRQTGLALPPRCEAVHSLEEAVLRLAHEPEWFVLGGAEVFAQALPLANYLYLTLVHAWPAGDAYFPSIPWQDWAWVGGVMHEPDHQHAHAFALNEYRRR